MKNVLAVEASTKACSVALIFDGEMYSEFQLAPQKHAELMLPMVQSVLQKAGISGTEIDILAFSEGPGAFTGVRVAAGVVQGLALGWDKPVVSISTLEALAWQALDNVQSHQSCLACLDARMQEIYIQSCEIKDGVLVSKPAELISYDVLKNRLLEQQDAFGTGDIEETYPELSMLFKGWQQAYPSATSVAQLAIQKSADAMFLSEALPMPVYLRNNVANKPSR